MNFPFLASVIIFILVLGRQIRRHTRLSKQNEKEFWRREHEANSTRRKSLEHLNYIQIPFDRLPINVMTDHETIHECLDILHTLSEQKIVNLTGYTNTDLKLEYGAPNITSLTAYDQNYTMLVRTLQRWADTLYEVGYFQEACTILEFALQTHTDVSRTYYTLAEIYATQGESYRIADLISIADSLPSINQKAIVRTLKESYPNNG